MKLIPNWRRAWRMLSVQAFALAGSLQLLWLELPPEVKAELPATLVHWVTLAVAVFGAVGRVVDQPKTRDKP